MVLSSVRSVLLGSLFFIVGNIDAFAPAKIPSTAISVTSLQFGFLKELGLEKPSWLPDFGSKNDEEEAPETVAVEESPDESAEDDASEE